MWPTLQTSNVYRNLWQEITAIDSTPKLQISFLDSFVICCILEILPTMPVVIDNLAEETNYQSTTLLYTMQPFIRSIVLDDVSIPHDFRLAHLFSEFKHVADIPKLILQSSNFTVTNQLDAQDIVVTVHNDDVITEKSSEELIIADIHPIFKSSRVAISANSTLQSTIKNRLLVLISDKDDLWLSKTGFTSLQHIKQSFAQQSHHQSLFYTNHQHKSERTSRSLHEQLKHNRYMKRYKTHYAPDLHAINIDSDEYTIIGNVELSASHSSKIKKLLSDKNIDAVALVISDGVNSEPRTQSDKLELLENAVDGVLITKKSLAPFLSELKNLTTKETIQLIYYFANVYIIQVAQTPQLANQFAQSNFTTLHQDMLIYPVAWYFESQTILAQLKQDWENEHCIVLDRLSESMDSHWFPLIIVTDNIDQFSKQYDNSLVVSIENRGKFWNLTVLNRAGENYQMQVSDKGNMRLILETLVRLKHWSRLSTYLPVATCKISVVICTYKRYDLVERAIESLIGQTLPLNDYEIIVVNNDWNDTDFSRRLQEWFNSLDQKPSDVLKIVDCPFKGLSFARNTGIAVANGEVVLFLDDDVIVTPEILDSIWQTYQYHDVGIVGGQIELIYDEEPEFLPRGLEMYWSHRVTSETEFFIADQWEHLPWGANWSARRDVLYHIGGFRANYGRKGKILHGGEEVVAAISAQRLGYSVGFQPMAYLYHKVDPSRFSEDFLHRRILGAIQENLQLQQEGYSEYNYYLRPVIQNILKPQVPQNIEIPELMKRYIRQGFWNILPMVLMDKLQLYLLKRQG